MLIRNKLQIRSQPWGNVIYTVIPGSSSNAGCKTLTRYFKLWFSKCFNPLNFLENRQARAGFCAHGSLKNKKGFLDTYIILEWGQDFLPSDKHYTKLGEVNTFSDHAESKPRWKAESLSFTKWYDSLPNRLPSCPRMVAELKAENQRHDVPHILSSMKGQHEPSHHSGACGEMLELALL